MKKMTRPIFINFFLPEKSDTVDVVWVGVWCKKSVAQVGVHSPGLLGLARLLLFDSIKVRLSPVQKKRGLEKDGHLAKKIPPGISRPWI